MQISRVETGACCQISSGSIFQLSEGAQNVALSLGITVVGIPACFFLFYAAIKKGIAETEEDDAQFRKKNRQF